MNQEPISGLPGGEIETGPQDYSPFTPFIPRLGTYILLFFLLVMWPAIGLTLLVLGETDLQLDKFDPVLFLFLPTIIIQWLIFLAVGLGVYRENSSFRSIGFARPKLSDVGKAVLFLLGSNLILAGLQLLLESAGMGISRDVDILVGKARESAWWWLAISITAAICEETVFRGYIITRVRGIFRHGGWLIPTLMSSFSFATGHTYQGTAGLIILFAYGLMFCALFLYTKSLWPGILAHFIQDFSAIFIYQYIGL
jgi:membrane protease YdiL (CAAX protease family)